MYSFFKKKIDYFRNILTEFVRKNLAQVIIVGVSFSFLEVIKSFPYVNIIPNYQYLVVGFIVILIAFIFGILIPSKNIVKTIIFFFILASITTIFEIEMIENLIGFIIYLLLFFVVFREVIKRRKEFKDTKNI
ncbi:hypothetical protein HZA75_01805 [Candidatus Roizmanbacteria bacterium]|nr:hypothetical protein [Candidatus Roizmanbacteria bacterium]